MRSYDSKLQKKKIEPATNNATQMRSSGAASTLQFMDNRPEIVAQRALQQAADNSLQVQQMKTAQNSHKSHAIQINVPSTNPHQHGAIAQKTQADVYLNGALRGSGSRARGGVGGVNHAEQLAWNDAESRVTNWAKINKNQNPPAELTISFMVDRPVCGDCIPWFEGEFWDTIKGIEAARQVSISVMVSVDYQSRYRSTQLNGPGTVWGGVGE